MRNTFNLHVRLHWQLLDSNTRSTLHQLDQSFTIYQQTRGFPPYRFRILMKKRVIYPVHCGKISHVVQEDGDFDDVLERGAGFVQDFTKISQSLGLSVRSVMVLSALFQGWFWTDCAISNSTLHQGFSFWVHAQTPRTIYHAIADDGLGIKGKRWRSLLRKNFDFIRHLCLRYLRNALPLVKEWGILLDSRGPGKEIKCPACR